MPNSEEPALRDCRNIVFGQVVNGDAVVMVPVNKYDALLAVAKAAEALSACGGDYGHDWDALDAALAALREIGGEG